MTSGQVANILSGSRKAEIAAIPNPRDKVRRVIHLMKTVYSRVRQGQPHVVRGLYNNYHGETDSGEDPSGSSSLSDIPSSQFSGMSLDDPDPPPPPAPAAGGKGKGVKGRKGGRQGGTAA